MGKKSIITSIIVIILLICSVFLYNQIKPTCSIRYSIINQAGLQDVSYGAGMSYEQTFKVKGKITLKNFGTCKIIITADAIGQTYNIGYNGKIRIFTYMNIEGDGTYDFVMDSFYKNGVIKVDSIENVGVKKV